MCGIAGLVAQHPINPGAIERMTTLMAHRGPDGAGYWANTTQTVGLGHRRLSILDLSSLGHQPMVDSTGRFVITFNGEIYNYLELQRDLRAVGVQFQSGSDTEVIIEAYKQWGTACLLQLNGMFAFALYDNTTGQLFCARDRYGEKPFLYVQENTFFAFASEYKALLSLTEVPHTYNENKLVLNTVVPGKGLDSDRQTVFTAIRQLLPSEAMLLDVNTLKSRTWTYWQVAPRPEYNQLTKADAADLFRALLTDSVRLRMRSDVPVGSCLSGGLDSSAIVSIVKKKLLPGAAYHTFTGVFPGTKADEWPFAKIVVDDTDVISHQVEPTSEGLFNELADFIWHNELPVSSTSQYAQWCVFRLAKEHQITVLLDGQGADELLGGYEQYFSYYLKSLREEGRAAFSNTEETAIRTRYPLALPTSGQHLRRLIPAGLMHLYGNTFNKGSSLLYGMHRQIALGLKDESRFEPMANFSALTAVLHQESFNRFLSTLLRYGDRNSMAHSREVRLPFCDHRLAELVLSLPVTHLMGEIQTKHLLRESIDGIVHDSIRTRWNKQGFRPPQETWFRGSLMTLARDLFASQEFQQSMYWDSRWWQAALNRIEQGETNLGWAVWAPFMIESWKQHFLHHPAFKNRESVFA